MKTPLWKKMIELIPENKEILYMCIGTDRSTGDAYGPLIGTRIKRLYKNLPVLGCLEETIDRNNIEEYRKKIKDEYPNHFVIAIDSCLGLVQSIGEVYIQDAPIRPGSGVGADIEPIGDVSICGVVNVSGFVKGMGEIILKGTKLSVVMNMVDTTVGQICVYQQHRKKQKLLRTENAS